MFFSIIVPLYNKAKSVRKTLLSIMNQTYTNFEIIVINDGSTDGSENVVAAMGNDKIRIYNQINQGVSVARNLGVEKAQYEQLVFVDADDLLAECYLENIAQLIGTFPLAGAYGTCYQYYEGGENRPCKIYQMGSKPTQFTNYFLTASRGDLPIVASGICIPKSVLYRVGLFPVGQSQGEDQDLWARIGLSYPVAVHPSVDITYVLDAENRVSVNVIPLEELEFSKRLQRKLDSGVINDTMVPSIKRYIAGHLIHLAELNVRAGNYSVAKRILSDPRTRQLWKRKIKWTVYLKLLSYTRSSNCKLESKSRQSKAKSKHKLIVANLLNDTDMGGILSVVESLAESKISVKFKFTFNLVNPSKWSLKKYASDVVMVHYASSWSTIIPNVLLRLSNYKSKAILQEHHYTETFESAVPSTFRFRLMLRINYFIFDKVIAVSKGQAGWIKKSSLINQSNLEAIPQSRNIDLFLKVQPREPKKIITVGAYGRLCSVKGFDLLIQAFNQIDSERLCLKIAGDGPLERDLKALAGNNRRINFVGRVSDVPQFLSSCDLIIIPSVNEAFGLACLEAKAAGKAVIVSDIDGLSEQVETRNKLNKNQTCGQKMENISVKSLVSTLLLVPYMPLENWGNNGRKDVVDAWDKYQKRWSKLFLKLESEM